MSVDLLTLDLRLRRRSIAGYALGMAAYALLIVLLYPSFKDDASLNQFSSGSGSQLAALFGASGSLTSPTGWLNANLYANFVPLIVLLMAIGYGASALAGQAEEGTLGLMAALPVARRSLLLQKYAALCLQTLPLVLLTALCSLAGRGVGLTVSAAGLVGISLGSVLIGIVFGSLALLVGALTGSRAAALATASVAAVAAYVIGSLAPVVSWMHPLRFVSPLYYAIGDGQLTSGLGWRNATVLVGLAAALLLGCMRAFDRLDIP